MIEALPDEPETDFSAVASELEKLIVHKKIAKGIAELDRGEGHSQKGIEDSMAAWAAEPRTPGVDKGLVEISEDFDAPLPPGISGPLGISSDSLEPAGN